MNILTDQQETRGLCLAGMHWEPSESHQAPPSHQSPLGGDPEPVPCSLSWSTLPPEGWWHKQTQDSYHQDDILLVIVVTKWEKVWPHKYLTFTAPTPPSKPVPVPKGMMGRRCLWQTFAKALTSSTQRGNTTTSGGRHLHKNNAMLSHSVFSTSPKNHTHSSHCSQQLSQKPQLTTHVFASGCVSL